MDLLIKKRKNVHIYVLKLRKSTVDKFNVLKIDLKINSTYSNRSSGKSASTQLFAENCVISSRIETFLMILLPYLGSKFWNEQLLNLLMMLTCKQHTSQQMMIPNQRKMSKGKIQLLWIAIAFLTKIILRVLQYPSSKFCERWPF